MQFDFPRPHPRQQARSDGNKNPHKNQGCISRRPAIGVCISANVALLTDSWLGRTGGTKPEATALSQPRCCARRVQLHNSVAQELVFSGEQILHESVAAFIRVTHCAGEMMIDSHPSRTTEIICDGENFIRGFTLAE